MAKVLIGRNDQKTLKMLNNLYILALIMLASCQVNDAKEKVSIPRQSKMSFKNPVTYFEIPVQNMERAITFYETVFCYTFEKDSIDGNEMAFFPLDENGRGISGALAKGKTYNPSQAGTLIYFNSEDIEKTLANRGKILYPKTSIGTLGFVAEFEDSEGNRIGLHQEGRKINN
jgi:uncharacterized protein